MYELPDGQRGAEIAGLLDRRFRLLTGDATRPQETCRAGDLAWV